ncbi:MAG: spore germination protein [Christensenellaceae bacterium]|nr:spore germination protein [Christensenellaceae bacterium]
MKNTVSSDIEKNHRLLKKNFEGCFDIVMRRLKTGQKKDVLIIFSDGLADKELIEKSIIAPFLGFAIDIENLKIKNIEDISEKLLSSVQIQKTKDLNSAMISCLSGDAVVFVDGAAEALVIQMRKWQSRGIPEPEIQRSVRGPKEGFTETLLFNVAMLRRKIRTPKLKTEIIKIGSVTKTDVCLTYIDGIADKKLITLVRGRLKNIKASYILESGHIEQLIEDKHTTLFATTGNNEKPDVVAAKLLKGRVAIIVDGSPCVLTAPMLMSENFQSPEDFYSRPFYSNFIRILRYAAYIITLVLPSLYVALVTMHRSMIPPKLLSTIIMASEGAPISIALEIYLLLIVYELLREAMLRLPSAVGSSVGLVGVLIIGEAAVSVNLIGAPTVVVCAVTFIASAVVSPLTDSATLLRFTLLSLSAILGAYGVFLGLFVILTRLCSLTSYGCPYMLPIAPFDFSGIKNGVLRLGLTDLKKRENE